MKKYKILKVIDKNNVIIHVCLNKNTKIVDSCDNYKYTEFDVNNHNELSYMIREIIEWETIRARQHCIDINFAIVFIRLNIGRNFVKRCRKMFKNTTVGFHHYFFGIKSMFKNEK